MDDIFLQKNIKVVVVVGGGGGVRPPDWPQYWPPATPETEVFFRVACIFLSKDGVIKIGPTYINAELIIRPVQGFGQER